MSLKSVQYRSVIRFLYLKGKSRDKIKIKQSGYWRATIRRGEDIRIEIKSILLEEKAFCLHFCGKIIGNYEYQIVCLKRSLRKLNLVY